MPLSATKQFLLVTSLLFYTNSVALDQGQWRHEAILQESIMPDNPNHIITKRRPVFHHDVYETIAQASCSSMAIKKHIGGFVYAIRRPCPHQQNCIEICNSLHLRVLDSETAHLPWSAIGAFHVYTRRSSSTIVRLGSTQGLKVLWKNDYEYERGCGPNYCCCHVSKN